MTFPLGSDALKQVGLTENVKNSDKAEEYRNVQIVLNQNKTIVQQKLAEYFD